MKKLIIPLLLFLCFTVQAQDVGLPQQMNSTQVVEHLAYTLCYDEFHEQARWVAYSLTKAQAEADLDRSNNFRSDPLVTTGSAEYGDYTGTGYDRGHLAPAADFEWSEEAMSESFYMSNISPQHRNFNRGKWLSLEKKVREWAKEYDKVYIVAGPILNFTYERIGENSVPSRTTFTRWFWTMKDQTKRLSASSCQIKNFNPPLRHMLCRSILLK